MTRTKTVFKCSACGWKSPKWMGRCSGCSAWNTLIEERSETGAKGGNDKRSFRLPEAAVESAHDVAKTPVPLSSLATSIADRAPTGMGELDRVLGGGLVAARRRWSAAIPGSASRRSSCQLWRAPLAGSLGRRRRSRGPKALRPSEHST